MNLPKDKNSLLLYGVCGCSVLASLVCVICECCHSGRDAGGQEGLALQIRQLTERIDHMQNSATPGVPDSGSREQEAVSLARKAAAEGHVEDALTYVLGAIRLAPREMKHYRYLVELSQKDNSAEDLQRLLEIMEAATCQVTPGDVKELKTLTGEIHKHLQETVSVAPEQTVAEAPALELPEEAAYAESVSTLQAWLDTVPEDDGGEVNESTERVEHYAEFLQLMRDTAEGLQAVDGLMARLPENAGDKALLNTTLAHAIAMHLKQTDENVERLLRLRMDDLAADTAEAKRVVAYADRLDKQTKAWAEWCELCTLRAELQPLYESVGKVEKNMEEIGKALDEAQAKTGKRFAPAPNVNGKYTELMKGGLLQLKTALAEVSSHATTEAGSALCTQLAEKVESLELQCPQQRSLLYQQWALDLVSACHKNYTERSDEAKKAGKKEAEYMGDVLKFKLVWIDSSNLSPLAVDAYVTVYSEILNCVAEKDRSDCKIDMGRNASNADDAQRMRMPITSF